MHQNAGTLTRRRISISSTTTFPSVQDKSKAGDVLGASEKTATDKKRERRKKKKAKRLKIQEREKRKKLKEAAGGGEAKKKSKAEVAETLRKLSAGGKAKILTVCHFYTRLCLRKIPDFTVLCSFI